MTEQMWMTVLSWVIPPVATYLVTILAVLIHKHISVAELLRISGLLKLYQPIIEKFINVVETTYATMGGPEKEAQAIALISADFEKHGIPLSASDIQTLLTLVLAALKLDWSAKVTPAPAPATK
jgi:hypothetical protein